MNIAVKILNYVDIKANVMYPIVVYFGSHGKVKTPINT